MRRKYNLILDLLDDCRVSGDKKLALALFLGIKFAYANSRLYDISVTGIMKFYHCSYKKAVKALEIFKTDTKLFTYYEESQFVKANCLKSDEVKYSKNINHREYVSDKVCKLEIPKCYEKKQTLSLNDLLTIIKRIFVRYEYDSGSGYKYKRASSRKAVSFCEMPKSQLQVAERTGYSRATVGRVMNEYVKAGIYTKTDRYIERVHAGDPHSFVAINKKTRFPYFLRCVPTKFSQVKDDCMKFMHIIWNHTSRINRKFAKKVRSTGNGLEDSVIRYYARQDGYELVSKC